MDRLTKKDSASLNIVDENIAALKQIFPEAFNEDGIDFDTLRQLLGDAVNEKEEKYGLNWHGKRRARQIALTPSTGTLRPCPEKSVDWDTTQNLFIEGDNLEVLKLLQRSYAGKVKMIYIDPPYNTGKDFIYPDNYQDNLDTYLRYTGQKSDEGFKTTSNPEQSGRFHTNWLNMMYPRLKLAHQLLREDGVIFISIDDNEVDNLKKICNEIFGEENFIAELIWERAYSPKNDARFISKSHDYILMLCKLIDKFTIGRLPRTDEANARYKNPDNDPRGIWKPSDLSVKTYNIECDYPITTPTGRIIEPPKGRCWSLSKKAFLERLQDNRIWFGPDGNSTPSIKRFITELKNDGMAPTSILFYKEVGHSQEGAKEIITIFEGSNNFNGPKPIRLLKRLLILSNANTDDIILDFFAGSSTTAHAVIQSNVEDKANRKFIMVQLPEPCEEKTKAFKDGYKTIADISKERIRRAAKKIQEEHPDYDGDLGFKVFKLDSSNIRAWQPNPDDLFGTLQANANHLVEGRSEQDILYELLLKRGVDLSVPIEAQAIAGKTVYSIGYGVLFACLDQHIDQDDIEALAMGIIKWREALNPEGETQVVFRDSAFANDIAKTNITAMLEQNGIAHVRSL